MLEAMYDDDENNLAQKLLDYDFCNYQGACYNRRIFQNFLTLESLILAAGTNECDRVAKVHKCGVEKDPELVSNMIQVADVSTPIVFFFILNLVL